MQKKMLGKCNNYNLSRQEKLKFLQASSDAKVVITLREVIERLKSAQFLRTNVDQPPESKIYEFFC